MAPARLAGANRLTGVSNMDTNELRVIFDGPPVNAPYNITEIPDIESDLPLNEPFDLESFRNNPNPKIFDPAKIIKASEPFDVAEFIRSIHEGGEV